MWFRWQFYHRKSNVLWFEYSAQTTMVLNWAVSLWFASLSNIVYIISYSQKDYRSTTRGNRSYRYEQTQKTHCKHKTRRREKQLCRAYQIARLALHRYMCVNVRAHFHPYVHAIRYLNAPYLVSRSQYKFELKIQIQKGLLKQIHAYSNLPQCDSTKMITNIKYPLWAKLYKVSL